MNFDEATEQEIARFHAILLDHGVTACPACAQPIDMRGCATSGGSTEAGTDFCAISVACHNCGEEIAVRSSWGTVESVEDFLDELENEWVDER